MDNRHCIRIESKEYISNYQVEMFNNNTLRCFLPLEIVYKDRSIEIYYDTQGKATLKEYTTKEQLSKSKLIEIIKKTILAVDEAKEYLLYIDNIDMNFDNIYIDSEKGEVEIYFIYIPLIKEKKIEKFDLSQYINGLISCISIKDERAIELSHKIRQIDTGNRNYINKIKNIIEDNDIQTIFQTKYIFREV